MSECSKDTVEQQQHVLALICSSHRFTNWTFTVIFLYLFFFLPSNLTLRKSSSCLESSPHFASSRMFVCLVTFSLCLVVFDSATETTVTLMQREERWQSSLWLSIVFCPKGPPLFNNYPTAPSLSFLPSFFPCGLQTARLAGYHGDRVSYLIKCHRVFVHRVLPAPLNDAVWWERNSCRWRFRLHDFKSTSQDRMPWDTRDIRSHDGEKESPEHSRHLFMVSSVAHELVMLLLWWRIFTEQWWYIDL